MVGEPKNFKVRRAVPARGNQGAVGLFFSSWQLNDELLPTVTGALGVIGFSCRDREKEVMAIQEKLISLESVSYFHRRV